MEIKRNYRTNRPDALIRDGRVTKIWVPEHGRLLREGYHELPVVFTEDERKNIESGRIEVFDQGTYSYTRLITEQEGIEVKILNGLAYLLSIKYPIQNALHKNKFPLECAVIYPDDDSIDLQMQRGLLYTWIAAEANTEILTVLKSSNKGRLPEKQIPFGIQQVNKVNIPSGYWDRIISLHQLSKP